PGRTLPGITLDGTDQGQFVAGGTRRVSENVDMFGENVYDLFGQHAALTQRYGVDYRATSALTLGGAIEYGTIRDDSGDFDRLAPSLSLDYTDGDRISSHARLEYRRDRGEVSGTSRDQDIFLFLASGSYKLDDEKRLLFGFEYADNDVPANAVMTGKYIDGSIGYAIRPVLDDRFNMLVQYRYLYDMVGQDIDGSATRGPRQQSHVFSIDAEYDISQNWTLGGKLGLRLSNSAPDDATALARNDAWLTVMNGRYHVNKRWDLLLEGRYFQAQQADIGEFGLLAAGYRQVGQNLKLGAGYNFGRFSDDLTDLTLDDKGLFINLIAKF
uniref:transporter n=1 Tax=Actibacterium sp. TaxID=1872125 RepID=UPI003564F0E3